MKKIILGLMLLIFMLSVISALDRVPVNQTEPPCLNYSFYYWKIIDNKCVEIDVTSCHEIMMPMPPTYETRRECRIALRELRRHRWK